MQEIEQIMEDYYVCPNCKLPLSTKASSLLCQRRGLEYLSENEIPDFVVEDLSKSQHPVLRSVSSIDRLGLQDG